MRYIELDLIKVVYELSHTTVLHLYCVTITQSYTLYFYQLKKFIADYSCPKNCTPYASIITHSK